MITSQTRLRYRGLILDFAGVLTIGIRESQDAWCTEEGLTPGAWGSTLQNHPEGRRLYLALEAGEIGQHEWNGRMAPLFGLDDSFNLMGRAWAAVGPAASMVDLARAARAKGMVLGLLSNSFGTDPFDPYAHCGIWDLFDVHVVSEREGVAKPDPAIYQRALDRMQVPAEECVFVDDNQLNLPPAVAVGMMTIHATDQADTVRRLAAAIGVPGNPATMEPS
ncbi:MAG: HAD family hydrolase [Streptomyces sp.]|uniref:HAD family hydrolase n=1 Tax=Streptomyces sp. TaxID=1931 RepID=UPI003D6B0BBF